MPTADAAQHKAALGLTAQTRETLEPRELSVNGEVPKWLTGSLLRNGPGDWSVGADRLAHWFDGFALLHHFSFSSGRVHYASRFLDTDARRHAQTHRTLAAREFASDPCRSIFKRVQSLFRPELTLTDNANAKRAETRRSTDRHDRVPAPDRV
jgi:beta,beta-carotene 9',10'-dioxygenase